MLILAKKKPEIYSKISHLISSTSGGKKRKPIKKPKKARMITTNTKKLKKYY